MDESDYAVAQAQLLALTQIVATMPSLSGMVAAIDRATSVAPILDPTLFRKASPNLRTIRRLAVALRAFQVEIEKLQAEGKLQLQQQEDTP